MVEAENPHKLHPTSILDVENVTDYLEMLWMGIWVHPYTVTPVRVGVDFREIGAWRSPSDFVVSCWLRLQNLIDCIPQPWHIYAKCLSTLRCCGWAWVNMYRCITYV
jgi:hypothetical protein